ncbi:hypothetical protein M3A49_31085 [Paraburkholderia sp. CNPSo 3076]|uniref:hypothetical protein n=1 Tax=Paraburkholderia sp. CNPSo 3076 TaxID=2940936 RepID=UPI0022504352|nr:hypothetical protein [Paraburkholderia sp. CNPSo 3076]MCX5543877.1 hypothetical protein [Paraburkholderia sp. CNPSo 3076]
MDKPTVDPAVSQAVSPEISPPVADDILLSHLRQLHEVEWPANLYRYAAYALSEDKPDVAYVAVAWDPATRMLHAQTVDVGEPPPASRLPELVKVDADDWISRVRPIAGAIRPEYMNAPVAAVPSSMLTGCDWRMALVSALIMVDPVGEGQPSDWIVNDFVFFDKTLRNRRIKAMREALGGGAGFRPYMIKLLTKFIWYGGDYNALFSRTPERGGPGKERTNPAAKPGPLTAKETLDKARANAQGKVYVRRARRVGLDDIRNMEEGLTIDWADDKTSLATTHSRMVYRHYGRTSIDKVLSYRALKYRYGKIVQKKRLLERRNGRDLTIKHIAPRPGTSSELTQGVLEILDIDGFRPKIATAALVGNKIVAADIVIIFALSRLTGALRGYAICTEGERADGYQRCLISTLLPLDYYLEELGQDPLPGLVQGNFDGVFVDNGPGKAKAVRKATTESYGGIMFNPPGARPDLKPVVERFNEIIINIVSEETQQGYKRANDPLEKTKRRERSKLAPILPRALERVVLRAIDVYNRTSNKSHLRTAKMRRKGTDISPADLHEYHQKTRRAKAKRIRSAAEVFDIFLPWKRVRSARGRILFRKARYSSNELKAVAEAHSRLPGKKTLWVEVKSPFRGAQHLLCRVPDGTVFEIEMIDEDKVRFGEDLTWLEFEFAKMDERVRGQKKAHERATSTSPGKRRPSGSTHSKAQGDADSPEDFRTDDLAGAIGATKADARRNSAAFRAGTLWKQQKAAYAAKHKESAESEDEAASFGMYRETGDDEACLSDDPLAEAARLAEEEYLGDTGGDDLSG